MQKNKFNRLWLTKYIRSISHLDQLGMLVKDMQRENNPELPQAINLKNLYEHISKIAKQKMVINEEDEN